MTTVSAIFARKQIEHAAHHPDKQALLNIVGLTSETIKDPAVMIPILPYFDLLEAIAETEFPELKFHVKTCQSMRCDEFGVFGLAFKSAPTLRHGFQRIWRYTRLHNRVGHFSAEEVADQFCWSMQVPYVNRRGAFLSNEAAMGTTLALCRETTSAALMPRHVQFSHERQGSIDALVEHFGCVPEFGARNDALHFDVAQVDQPCTIGDPGIWSFLIGQLDQTLAGQVEEEPSFEGQVVEEIAKLLTGGVPQLSDVAKTMGVGGRTFQRRLNERGNSFQSLVDQSRQALAQKLIKSSSYSLSEIAFLTGFSEQSAFSRAFKRWTGKTPKAYRTGLLVRETVEAG